MFVMGDITSTVKVWQNGSYVLASGVELSNGAKIVNKELAFGYYAWTYEILDENGQRIDHAKVELIDPKYVQVQLSQDEENIFSEDRYIRLQCEYTEKGVKNEQHILWHKQQVYRNVTLQGVTDDHIMNLRTSIHGNAR